MNKEVNIVAVVHQHRETCFNKHLFGEQTVDVNGKRQKIRFMNCSVLKLTLTRTKITGGKIDLSQPDLTLTVELIHDGELDEQKPDYVYYTTKGSPETPIIVNNDDGSIKCRTIAFPVVVMNDSSEILRGLKITRDFGFDRGVIKPGVEYNFYIVRHGQAEHNSKSGASKYWGSLTAYNTHLTDVGKHQAVAAGHALEDLLNSMPDYAFVSDLVRTHETLKILLDTMSDISEDGPRPPIIMLPCSHEINKTCETCDGCRTPSAGENKVNTDSFGSGLIDENFYHNFYQGVRGDMLTSRRNCINHTFIGLALELIAVRRMREASNMSDADLNSVASERRTAEMEYEKVKRIEQAKKDAPRIAHEAAREKERVDHAKKENLERYFVPENFQRNFEWDQARKREAASLELEQARKREAALFEKKLAQMTPGELMLLQKAKQKAELDKLNREAPLRETFLNKLSEDLEVKQQAKKDREEFLKKRQQEKDQVDARKKQEEDQVDARKKLGPAYAQMLPLVAVGGRIRRRGGTAGARSRRGSRRRTVGTPRRRRCPPSRARRTRTRPCSSAP